MIIAHCEEAVAAAQQHYQDALGLMRDLKAKRHTLDEQEDALNTLSCSLPIPERATQLLALASQAARIGLELRLAEQAVAQAEVAISETRLQLQRSTNREIGLRQEIDLAEEKLRQLLASGLPANQIMGFRSRAERDVQVLRERYTALFGHEAPQPAEAA